MKRRITFDFETRAFSNLKLEGAYKYSLHDLTQPTCLAFKEHGNRAVYFLDFKMVNTPWRNLPDKLKNLWTRYILEGFQFSAHNAFFETCIYKNILVRRYGWPDIPFRQFRCTAAKAAACALPRSLGGAGEAMKLTMQKDKRGYNAMMATCKPTKAYNAWVKLQNNLTSGKKMKAVSLTKAQLPAPPMFLELEHAPAVWATLYEYCKRDVLAEEALDDALPDLIPDEQEIWFLNQRLNWRGLPIDTPTVEKIVGIMDVESKIKLKELDQLTLGLVTKPGARKSILEFLELEGVVLPDIRAKTVDESLDGFMLSENGRRLLEIRQALSKTSTKKYQSFLNRAMPDGRVRDILLYHGASTGRDTGTGVQPHNFPRGVLKMTPGRPYEAVDNVAELETDMLHVLYGTSLSMVFSSILRNMLIPSKGKELFVADFSKIEVAVLWWAAGNDMGLKILRSGKDPYIYQAAANLSETYENVEAALKREEKWAVDARQLAKAQILGCGFGMGAKKFRTTGAEQYGLNLTRTQSVEAVTNYRKANAAVPVLWEAYENAATWAVENFGKTYRAGKCEFKVKDKFLWIKLPSGRSLAYRDPELIWSVREFEIEKVKIVNGVEVVTTKKMRKEMQMIEFSAVNSKTKKWERETFWGGTITENCIQAIARDLIMPAMVRLEKADYLPLLMVHDEALCEKPIGEGSISEFVNILCELPKWADGLPLEAKGWSGPRYRK